MSRPVRLVGTMRHGRNKYGNVRTTVDGITFDSAREARRYQELTLLAQAGQIARLARQVPFAIVVNNEPICRYVADFTYVTPEGEYVVEDVKGYASREFKLKAKLLAAQLGIVVREV